jgi:hypothetical protein
LLAWNTEIVAGSYYSSRLVGSPFEFSYASFVALTFTTGNLLFLAHANATQQGVSLPSRKDSLSQFEYLIFDSHATAGRPRKTNFNKHHRNGCNAHSRYRYHED